MDGEATDTSDGHGEGSVGRRLPKRSRVAHLGNLLFGARHLVPNIVGLVLLLPVGFLVLMGLLGVDTGLLGPTNPSPVPATLDQIATNSVQDGRLWVTVSGRLEPESHPWVWKGLDYGRAYVLTASGRGLVIVSDQPIGQPGSQITVTGFLWRGWHVWANGSNWNDWARETYPSAGMMDDVYMTHEGPPGSGAAAVGLGLLAGAGLIVALYLRWRLRRKTPPSWSFVYPGSWPSPGGPAGGGTPGYGPPLSQVGFAVASGWPAPTVGAEPSATGSTASIDPEAAGDGSGRPCSVYPIQSLGATILPTKFDVAFVADSFQGALVLALAAQLNPKFPGLGSPDCDLVIRSRIIRADAGSRFLRWLFPFVAGSAVFEVEAQMTDRGVLLAHVRGHGTRRFGLGGASSQDLLAGAAKLAGEHVAEMLLDIVDAPNPAMTPGQTAVRLPPALASSSDSLVKVRRTRDSRVGLKIAGRQVLGNSRTIRDIQVPFPVAPIADAWAAANGFQLVFVEPDGSRRYRCQRAMGGAWFCVVRQLGPNTRIETWTYTAAFNRIPFLIPSELSVESGHFVGALPRSKCRNVVNQLLAQLGQPLIQ